LDKALITGKNGYVATGLYNGLKDKYDIERIGRDDFDLTDYESTCNYFKDKYFDVVIHTAMEGGSRIKIDSIDVLDNNIKMYYNLLANKSHYNKFITFGSGAEFHAPESPYGLSKCVISKSIIDKPNFYNLRIYGLFDENELNTRFIKSNIKRYLNNESIEIHHNKLFDFFYMEDLISLVSYYIDNENLESTIDCCYTEKWSLCRIADFINTLDNKKPVNKNVKVLFGNEHYVGKPLNVPIKLIGLKEGIKRVYNKLNK
jgi:GDP-L-fucose synthase